MTNIETLQRLAMAVCEAHEMRHAMMVAKGIYVFTVHNAMPALLAIAKGQLEHHYQQWTWFQNVDENDVATLYHAKQHRTICTQLASIQGESPELVAFREALK